MIDYARITVKAGKGGDGSGSFVHIKGKRRGKADGGDGGSGGNVYLEATNDLKGLEPFRFVKEYKASNGVSGLSKRRQGAQGEDLVLKVPVGTVVRFAGPVSRFPPAVATGEYLYDLNEHGQKRLVASGGAGGKGNSHLRDEFGRRPFQGAKGEDGEIVKCELELKLIADVGLVGLPNAGKSSLITALTWAKPKVASYPFTTLEPNLGVMSAGPVSGFPPAPSMNSGQAVLRVYPERNRRAVGDPSRSSLSQMVHPSESKTTTATRIKRVIIADIPGLIEGASSGRGLGDLFLRHIERTRVIVHVIDVAGTQDVWRTYLLIRNELKTYSFELVKKKEIIAINKIDLVSEDVAKSAVDIFRSKKKKTVAVSAKTGENLDSLVREIIKTLKPKS